MQFTNSLQPYGRITRRATVLILVAAAFLSLPVSGDPYQPIRALAVAVALVFALVISQVEPRGVPRWILLALGTLIGWYLLAAALGQPASSLWGVHGRFQAVLSFLLMCLAGVSGWLLFRDDMRWLARVAAVAAAIQGAIVIAQAVTGAIPVGTIGNRALLGAWLAVTTTAAVASWRMEKGPFRWIAFSCAAVGAIALGLAGSRGAWLGLIIGVAVIVVAGGVRRGWPVVALGIVLVIAALGLGGEAASKLDPAALAGGSAASRMEIWRGTAALVADNALVGVGPGRYLYEFPQYQPVEHARIEALDTRPDQAHSHVLQMASDAGLPAAVLLIALGAAAFLGGIKGLRDNNPAALVALAIFTAYVTQALFGIGAIETDVLGWVVGGVLIGMLATDELPQWTSALRWVGVAVAALLGMCAAYYLVGDVSHGRGLDAFAEARFGEALEYQNAAVASDPLVDVYRVGQSDAALYLSGQDLQDAYESVEHGLGLEPMSYDLALARARLIAAGGASPSAVADAYIEAVALYPLGVGVRSEAAAALFEAARVEEARQMAEDVLLIAPDNPTALAILEATTDG